MKSNDELIQFNNAEEAEKLLNKSRKRIDEIDNEFKQAKNHNIKVGRNWLTTKNYSLYNYLYEVDNYGENQEINMNVYYSRIKIY